MMQLEGRIGGPLGHGKKHINTKEFCVKKISVLIDWKKKNLRSLASGSDSSTASAQGRGQHILALLLSSLNDCHQQQQRQRLQQQLCSVCRSWPLAACQVPCKPNAFPTHLIRLNVLPQLMPWLHGFLLSYRHARCRCAAAHTHSHCHGHCHCNFPTISFSYFFIFFLFFILFSGLGNICALCLIFHEFWSPSRES